MRETDKTTSAGLGGRIWALVPSSKRIPKPFRARVLAVADFLKTRIREQLDLPSRSELQEALLRLDDVDHQVQELAARTQHQATASPAQDNAQDRLAEASDELARLKKDLRKDLKRELQNYRVKKSKRKKGTTDIKVGSPKEMKGMREKRRAKPKHSDS